MENGKSALYLYCFARSDAVRAVRATAVDGQSPVTVLRNTEDLCVVVSEAAQEDFCGPGAEVNMRQLSWLAPRVLRHETVIEEVMASSPVLPVSFGTLFSSLSALTDFMDQHCETIAAFLRRVTDHGEWSVKGWFDRKQGQRALLSTRLTAQQKQLSAMSPGARHFAEQRLAGEVERELGVWLDQASRAIASELTSYASDFRECAVSSGAQSDDGRDEVLNWAFLLPESGVAQFQERLDRANLDCQSQGLSLKLSGPWPAYRFVPALSSKAAS